MSAIEEAETFLERADTVRKELLELRATLLEQIRRVDEVLAQLPRPEKEKLPRPEKENAP